MNPGSQEVAHAGVLPPRTVRLREIVFPQRRQARAGGGGLARPLRGKPRVHQLRTRHARGLLPRARPRLRGRRLHARTPERLRHAPGRGGRGAALHQRLDAGGGARGVATRRHHGVADLGLPPRRIRLRRWLLHLQRPGAGGAGRAGCRRAAARDHRLRLPLRRRHPRHPAAPGPVRPGATLDAWARTARAASGRCWRGWRPHWPKPWPAASS